MYQIQIRLSCHDRSQILTTHHVVIVQDVKQKQLPRRRSLTTGLSKLGWCWERCGSQTAPLNRPASSEWVHELYINNVSILSVTSQLSPTPEYRLESLKIDSRKIISRLFTTNDQPINPARSCGSYGTGVLWLSRSNYPETLAAVATTSVEVSQVHTAPQSGVDRTEYFNVFQKPTGGFTVCSWRPACAHAACAAWMRHEVSPLWQAYRSSLYVASY